MPDQLIIYHGGCFDGFTAAWVVASHPDWRGATLFAAGYGQPAPNVEGKEVLVVDFSYPRDVLLAMKDQAKWIQVLDHHKTAQADLEGLPFCEFDMNRSGCGMVCDFLAGARDWLINAVEDRDLWRFNLPDTKEIMAAVATLPHELDRWTAFAREGREAAVTKGAGILEYVATYNEKALAQAAVRSVGGVKVPVVNVPYSSASDCADLLLARYPDAPFAAAYFQRADDLWQFSLRSSDERQDVSEVAKRYGGGGHRNAAGFQVVALPWETT